MDWMAMGMPNLGSQAFWTVSEAALVRWECGVALAALVVYAWKLRRKAAEVEAEMRRERRMREELEAYAQLDTTVNQGAARVDRVPATKALAMRICRSVADKSVFRRVMVLFRGVEGELRCVGWIGVDDLTVGAVERWAAEVVRDEREGHGRQSALLGRTGAKSVSISLGEWHEFDPPVSDWELRGRKERRKWRRAIALPIRTGAGAELGGSAGRLMGAIVVCADGLRLPDVGRSRHWIERTMNPLESLAVRLGVTLDNELLGERLLRAEKLAGLGQLAGGVAHALNNPLTAVLGYADLIAETSSEARVQEDARTIATEALRMKETVQRLTEFWRPVTPGDAAVDVARMAVEAAEPWRIRLAPKGIKVEVTVHENAAREGAGTVRGSRERLEQVVEQLIKNAVQAIAEARAREEGEEHAIRISVAQDERMLSLIVSDTGTGFDEPGRAFDPFYTTKAPVEGAGLGLSICFGIVREHGGEIAAFNLHPHGAAVVVELPVGSAVKSEATVIQGDFATR